MKNRKFDKIVNEVMTENEKTLIRFRISEIEDQIKQCKDNSKAILELYEKELKQWKKKLKDG